MRERLACALALRPVIDAAHVARQRVIEYTMSGHIAGAPRVRAFLGGHIVIASILILWIGPAGEGAIVARNLVPNRHHHSIHHLAHHSALYLA